MRRLSLGGRIAILAALAVGMGHTPKEAQDIFEAPRRPKDPIDPKDPKAMERPVRMAADIDVEIPDLGPQMNQLAYGTQDPNAKVEQAPTVLATNHAMHAIIKAQQPTLNRKQRRQLAHRMQARATKKRQG